jgi:hypothetical protein
MSLKVTVCKRKTVRGGLEGFRLYIQFVDGMNCRWREFLPFFLNGGGTSHDKDLIERAKQIAIARGNDYAAEEKFAEQI